MHVTRIKQCDKKNETCKRLILAAASFKTVLASCDLLDEIGFLIFFNLITDSSLGTDVILNVQKCFDPVGRSVHEPTCLQNGSLLSVPSANYGFR